MVFLYCNLCYIFRWRQENSFGHKNRYHNSTYQIIMETIHLLITGKNPALGRRGLKENGSLNIVEAVT